MFNNRLLALADYYKFDGSIEYMVWRDGLNDAYSQDKINRLEDALQSYARNRGFIPLLRTIWFQFQNHPALC